MIDKQNLHQDKSKCIDLVRIIDEIEPNKLGSVSYIEYLNNIIESIKKIIIADNWNFVLLIQTIKNSKPCYRRDLLIEVLDVIMFSDDQLVCNILSNIDSKSQNNMWKHLANIIVTLPDLIANCRMLNKFCRFQQSKFYSILLDRMYETIRIESENVRFSDNKKYCYLLLLSRIAISGHSQVVWEKFTQKTIANPDKKLKNIVRDIITFPFEAHNIMSTQFEIFIEPLILPIFFYLKPNQDNGKIIYDLLGNVILSSESFEYIVCNKAILQSNYNQTKQRQKIILFNIFSYLSSLTNCNESSEITTIDSSTITCSSSSSSHTIENEKKTSLLIKTLLSISQSWSNKTKIQFRTHEHNRYISFAFIIAFKYALDYDKECILEYSKEIQSKIIQGLTIYLDRASAEERNLAMCLGELLLPILHQLIDSYLTEDQLNKKLPNKLKFDINWDDDCLEMKKLFNSRIEELFENCSELKQIEHSTSLETLNINNSNILKTDEKQLLINDLDKSFENYIKENNFSQKNQLEERKSSLKAKIVIIDDNNDNCANDEDDLVPYENVDDVDDNISGVEIGEDVKKVPIYLSDCIEGLIDNKNPYYVKLCLVNVCRLIQELSSQEPIEKRDKFQLKSSTNLNENLTNFNLNDTINDIAIELTKVLLYLDDQYNIEDFFGLRMKAIVSLAISSPALVVKYLLDEFNGDNRNIRHQLDILQVLVSSAQNLSVDKSIKALNTIQKLPSAAKFGKTITAKRMTTTALSSKDLSSKIVQKTNEFAKYASLYFYGIVHRLKISLGEINPTIIVTNRRWLDIEETNKISKIKTTPTKNNKNELIININNKRSNCSNDNISSNDNDSEKGLDDSYLLSRILFSISLIINCLNQQPITCKLSNDLLDILAAYKSHQDIGVRRAIISCLTVIRDCTPKVYFEEYLHNKTENLFGSFLADECDLIGRRLQF